MKIKMVVVDLEVSPRAKRWGLRLGIPAAIVVGMSAIAYAAPTWTTWTEGVTLTAANLNDNFKNLQEQITTLKTASETQQTTITNQQAAIAILSNGDPLCPLGYTQKTDDPTIAAGQTLCVRAQDQVVKVGVWAAAFWVDRFEASVWNDFALPVTQYGTASDNYPATFPDTGYWTAQVYAVSKAGVLPSAYITWFQANAACRASGKRLPNGAEWLAAAKGTVDGASCNTASSAAIETIAAGKCVSDWGAQDMIGNMWEWTSDWYAGLGNASTSAAPWPAIGISGDYKGDGIWNITSSAYGGAGGAGAIVGLPVAAMRGGDWREGAGSGVFAMLLTLAPSAAAFPYGFRCVLPSSH